MLKKIKNILFDADDTLWYDSKYFKVLENTLIKYGNNSGLEIDEIMHTLKENLKKEKKGEKGFANAILKTAITLNFKNVEIKLLRKEVKQFLNHPIELTKGITNFLQTSNHITKVVLTKGIYNEQIKKLEKSGLLPFFDNVIVVAKKNENILKSILIILDINPNETLSIGNSIIHDIGPAIKNKIKSVWFNHNYNYNGRNSKLPKEALEINNWNELSI